MDSKFLLTEEEKLKMLAIREHNTQTVEKAVANNDRVFYERLGRLRQASDIWFTPRLQADLETLIQMAEKYREHANSLTRSERQKPDQA